jgi:hypothetical protein
MKIVLFILHFLLSCLLFHSPCFFFPIKIDSASMLRTMEDRKKGVLCLDCLTLELEEKKNSQL